MSPKTDTDDTVLPELSVKMLMSILCRLRRMIFNIGRTQEVAQDCYGDEG